MRIAILGATSPIAKDLILSFARSAEEEELHLFARRPGAVSDWLNAVALADHFSVADFSAFASADYDAIINFVGVGNPAQTAEMGNSIFDITLQYDEMALAYLRDHPNCRYLFMSSGAAYGAVFREPGGRDTRAVVAINDLPPQEWYGVAKLYAECRHRSHPEYAIIDIRVFNYFSRSQDISSRFLITDMLRAIRDNKTMKTSPDHIVRDFLHPVDFYNLVTALLTSQVANTAVDCYSRAPIDKQTLLTVMENRFGLQYEITEASHSVNATGIKPNYYSVNTRAADFGYHPTLTSLEGILRESEAILERAPPHAKPKPK